MSHDDAKAAIASGSATIEGHEIDFKTQVLSKMVFSKEGSEWEAAVNGEGTIVVAIDTTKDEKLISAGQARR